MAKLIEVIVRVGIGCKSRMTSMKRDNMVASIGKRCSYKLTSLASIRGKEKCKPLCSVVKIQTWGIPSAHNVLLQNQLGH